MILGRAQNENLARANRLLVLHAWQAKADFDQSDRLRLSSLPIGKRIFSQHALCYFLESVSYW